MAEVKKLSMRDQCYAIIKEKILRQEYALGENINIVALSAELNVSNTPIREALSQLESDGLVTSTLGSKSQVISFTKTSFHEISQTIHLLVKGAYELCVSEDHIGALVHAMEDSIQRQQQRLDERDFYQFTHESVGFDRCIFQALGNTHLLAVFEGLSNILFLMYRTNHQKNEQQRARSIEEHREITAAIAGGNRALVERLLLAHYNRSHEEPPGADGI